MNVKASEMMKEHKHLVKVLRAGDKPAQKLEAKKQASELKEFKNKK